MKKVILVLTLFLVLQSCTTSKTVDIKSPCVSGDGGPCSNRKPVNTWLG